MGLLFLLGLQVIHPKTDEQRQRLQEACRDIILFKNLDTVNGLFQNQSQRGTFSPLLWLRGLSQFLIYTLRRTVHSLGSTAFLPWLSALSGCLDNICCCCCRNDII